MTDEPALAQLLRRAGLPDDLGELDALLAGIDAAPTARKADAWLELIGQDLPDALEICSQMWRTGMITRESQTSPPTSRYGT